MDKSLLIGLIAGAGAATAVGAVANFARHSDATPPAAQVSAQLPDDDQRGVVVREFDAPAAQPVAVLPAPAAAPASFAPAPVEAPRRAAAPVYREPAVRPAVRRASYAEVVDVQPRTRSVAEPREVCTDVPVQRQKPVRDEHQVAGTVIGAALGGVLGNQVGDGRGRDLAKVAGVLAGGYAGNKVQERIQRNAVETVMERRCETVYDQRTQADGYDVTYEFEGRTKTVRMQQAPGSRLPVRDGRVILTANVG